MQPPLSPSSANSNLTGKTITNRIVDQRHQQVDDAATLDIVPPPPSSSVACIISQQTQTSTNNAIINCTTGDQNNNTTTTTTTATNEPAQSQQSTTNSNHLNTGSSSNSSPSLHPLMGASFKQSETVFQQVSRNTPTNTSDSEEPSPDVASAHISSVLGQVLEINNNNNSGENNKRVEQEKICYSNDVAPVYAASVTAHEHEQVSAATNNAASNKFIIDNSSPSTHNNSKLQEQNEYVNDEDEYGRYARVDTCSDSPTHSQTLVTTTKHNPHELLKINEATKASKSEPTTPLNLTPTAKSFHQPYFGTNNSHKTPANTLPPDIRKNIVNSQHQLIHQAPPTFVTTKLDQIINKGEYALKSKKYLEAIELFNECEKLTAKSQISWPNEYLVYYYRAEANFYLEEYKSSLNDAIQARELNPNCIKSYYRQARAQFCLGKEADSLATFAFGLALNPNNESIFNKFVETARQSKFNSNIEPRYIKLEKLNLHRQPFVVTAIIGQELLELKHYQHAIVILESAIKIGTDNLKFRASVYSALSAAFWANNDREKSIQYLKEDLKAEEELKDVAGQCRVYCNLGFTHYLMRKYSDSLEYHRRQWSLAMKSKLYKQAAIALNAIGHVHVARNDLSCALTSHNNCLEILKELGENNYNQSKELVCIGHIYAMMGDFDSAVDKYEQSLKLLRESENLDELRTITIMINFNLAYIAIKKGNYNQVQEYYKIVIEKAEELGDTRGKMYEMRAYCGSGHAHRISKHFTEAKKCFQKQLELAVSCKDKFGKSQALCNLGMISQHFKDYDDAWKKFEENLKLVQNESHLLAYAHSYMASISYLKNNHKASIDHYLQARAAFENLGNCNHELKTINMNLRFVYEKTGHSDTTINSTSSYRRRSPVSQINFSG